MPTNGFVMSLKTLCVFGTRPEAIKMAPVIKRLEASPHIQSKVCVTGQHRQMLDAVLEQFDIVPDFNLDVMTEGQDLSHLTAQILIKLAEIYPKYMPDVILVHGDTTTTFAAALSAYYHQIPVAHVEAGLRTGNIYSPWPEEANRTLTGVLTTLHFAPTPGAKQHLLREGVDSKNIYVTGNTVIDALLEMRSRLASTPALTEALQKEFPFLSSKRKIILVTGHRRESFGAGFERICQALAAIARAYPEIDIVYPVHLNPKVQQPVRSLLGEITNIYLIPPVDYLPFIYLMQCSYIILTDSGGIQEEAPSLGKPVLVMRDNTERPEAVEVGTVLLVGTQVERIMSQVHQLLEDNTFYQQMTQATNPYGDGHAARRIVDVISERYGLKSEIKVKVLEKELVKN